MRIFKQIKNYRQAEHFLFHDASRTPKSVFRGTEGFIKSKDLLQHLGDPQDAHPSIHVAATSGKGTICYLVDSILRAHSLHTALMVSPHVYTIRERVQIDGQLVTESDFTHALTTVLHVADQADITPSYFEILLSMGFLVASKKKVSYSIVETGFGGLLDTTNAISRPDKLCVLGQIGYDHTAVLGSTLKEIAYQKAGIVQKGSHVIALYQSPEVNAVFEARCREQNAQLTWVERDDDYQITNDLMTLTITEYLARRDGWEFSTETAHQALENTFIPGRFEKRSYNNRLLILDGAHNPQKLAAVASRIQREHVGPVSCVFAIGERPDVANCIAALKPVLNKCYATTFATTQQDAPKAPMNEAALAPSFKEHDIPFEFHHSSESALAAASKDGLPILATGSFYLLGEIDRAMQA